MPDDHDSIIDTGARRHADGLKLAYVAVDDAGITRAAWGLEVEGDLPLLHPRALGRAVERLPWPDGFPHEHGSPDVRRIEERGVGQDIAHFIVEATPEAFVGAVVEAVLMGLYSQVKQWARPTWKQYPSAPQTQAADILVSTTNRAKSIAYDTFRDIDDDIDDLVVVSQSLSGPAALEDASAMIVLRASDGSTIPVQIWLADGGFRYTITRVFPE